MTLDSTDGLETQGDEGGEGEGGEVNVFALSKVEFRHLEGAQMAVTLETFTDMNVTSGSATMHPRTKEGQTTP